MRQSIGVRLIMIFVGLMVAVLIALWAANSFFLGGFYTKQKPKLLKDAYERLNEFVIAKAEEGENITDDLQSLYSKGGEQNEASRMLRLMNEKYNTTIVIVDSMNDNTVPPFRDGRFLAERVHQYILGRNASQTGTLILEDNYKIQESYDIRSQGYYLKNWGFFDDNHTIFTMLMPLASIHESVAISNKSMARVGLAVLVFGGILMYGTTKMVVSPIRSFAALSARMSELDFEARYTGNSKDEIGILGHSMNTLSEELKETIGALKAASNKLQRDIEEKIRIDEVKKDSIANVSHELKMPIALIQGYAEGLTEGTAEDPESRGYYYDVIMDKANKMNKMVEQFLNLTVLEFGSDMPVTEQFDLVILIQGILSLSGILLQQKDATVIFEPTGPVRVWTGEFKIEEVTINYLNNALSHLEGEKRIEIRVEQLEGEVRVTVSNTGQRIPEEDLDSLWTKLYKVGKVRTREYGGNGVGLSTVKVIMDSHNKACSVENVDDGVRFWSILDSRMQRWKQTDG